MRARPSRRLRPILARLAILACGLAALPAFARASAPDPVSTLAAQAPGLSERVLRLALTAHDRAAERGLLPDPTTLTVIDYSRPSIVPRFWVFDLEEQRLLFVEHVAHGRNSGELLATRFSNAAASLETSLGLFVTGDVYFGEHGESLRLDGLEPGVNDRARERQIVIHGADYVSDAAIATLGFLGRSWGCPALPPTDAPRVIERLRGGSAVFAFYPDRRWLGSSRFLQGAPSAP